MSGNQHERKYIEVSIAKEEAFAQGKAELIEQVETLAREHNTEVLIVLKRPEDPTASAKRARILQSQAELDSALEDLKQEKERNKAIKEKLKLFHQKHNFKKIEDLSMEELLSAKTRLEAIRENINQQRAEILASMSSSQSESDKKVNGKD